MLSAHSNMAEEIDEWNRLRFGACQQAPDNYSVEEAPAERRVSTGGEDGIMQKRRILEKRVSFPSDESMLVQNLEPTVPDVPGINYSSSAPFSTACNHYYYNRVCIAWRNCCWWTRSQPCYCLHFILQKERNWTRWAHSRTAESMKVAWYKLPSSFYSWLCCLNRLWTWLVHAQPAWL